MDGHTATRRTTRGVALKAGDQIRVEGVPDQSDSASVDYLQIKTQ
jgi:hypothetical protein